MRDPYKGDAVASATQRLVAWAERHALADGQWLGYHFELYAPTPSEASLMHAPERDEHAD